MLQYVAVLVVLHQLQWTDVEGELLRAVVQVLRLLLQLPWTLLQRTEVVRAGVDDAVLWWVRARVLSLQVL